MEQLHGFFGLRTDAIVKPIDEVSSVFVDTGYCNVTV
jgi:hypothetical protein